MELGAIERETKRFRDIRDKTERDLEECRRRGVGLEDVREIQFYKDTMNVKLSTQHEL